MKILKRFLYFLLTLFSIFCIFVIVCALRPDITEKVADFLYSDSEQTMTVKTNDNLESKETIHLLGNTEQISSDTQDFAIPMEENAGLADDISASYIQPNQSEIVVPESVSGRNGYQQLQDESEQIDEETTKQLEAQLDLGYTGDGLTFDEVYYPYYAMLDEKGKHIYRQVYANASAVYPSFAPVEEVSVRQLENIIMAVYNDHPDLFWVETAYACKYKMGGQCVEITLKFNRTAQNLESAKSAFHEAASPILAAARQLPSDYEKEKFVHDALIDNISYSLSAEMNQSAYSALVNEQTVCAGYSRAFQYLLQQLGIPCYYCTGYAGESHAWNIVALEDGYYNVDTTWDDTDYGTYDYFNKTDDDYASNHIRQEMSVYLPPCNGQIYRDLEQSEAENNLRSMEDVGIPEEQLITNMAAYNVDCYENIVNGGKGNYTFYNVIAGEQLLEEWYQDYESDAYGEAYMNSAMEAIGLEYCEIFLEIEALQDDKYLITHKTSAW